MISVIVPVYNTEKYLHKCIDSIINQTYRDLEIILVDDGSRDKSGAICEEYAKNDKRISVIHQINGGLSAARNIGLDNCKGEYIFFVDSDDTIDAKTLETMLRPMEKGSYDLAICGHQRIRNGERPIPVYEAVFKEIELSEDKLWNEIFGKLNNAAWNKLYRKITLDNIRFPNGIIHGEDLIFNLNLLCNCQSGILIAAPFYHYYERAGSITRSTFNENKINEIIAKDIAREIVENKHASQLDNANKYCFRARMNVLRAIYKARKENNYQENIKEYKEYIRNHYQEIKKSLRAKERVEYLLFQYVPFLYFLITRR